MRLAIYGSGSLGREVADLAIHKNQWDEIFFIDDTKEDNTIIGGINSIKFSTFDMKYHNNKNEIEVIIAIGEPQNRSRLYDKVVCHGYQFGKLISNNAVISSNSVVGDGCVIFEFSTIHAGANIGVNTIIQPNVVINHDIIIGNHCVISSLFSSGGKTIIGDRVFIGLNGVCKEKLKIGNDVIVGMGAVVIRDVADRDVVVGNPAKSIQHENNKLVFK